MKDKPVSLPHLRPVDLARCKACLLTRLHQVVFDANNAIDPGAISNLVADLRALDYVDAGKCDPNQPEPPAEKPLTIAQDAVAVRALAAAQSKRERMADVEAN